nr:hypothetical protein B0A51_13651 [Rachicladosporium sp. CCFEE 5018]
MAKAVTQINWRYLGDAIPAFLAIAIMPFSYSIAYGLIASIVSYIILNGGVWVIEKVSGGRIEVPEKELKEPWTYKLEGGDPTALDGKGSSWKARLLEETGG